MFEYAYHTQTFDRHIDSNVWTRRAELPNVRTRLCWSKVIRTFKSNVRLKSNQIFTHTYDSLKFSQIFDNVYDFLTSNQIFKQGYDSPRIVSNVRACSWFPKIKLNQIFECVWCSYIKSNIRACLWFSKIKSYIWACMFMIH